MTEQAMDCPICEKPAKREDVTTFMGFIVRCPAPECGEYGISSDDNLERLRNSSRLTGRTL
jgi:hypothetical protein